MRVIVYGVYPCNTGSSVKPSLGRFETALFLEIPVKFCFGLLRHSNGAKKVVPSLCLEFRSVRLDGR